jgi:hypothetical protein
MPYKDRIRNLLWTALLLPGLAGMAAAQASNPPLPDGSRSADTQLPPERKLVDQIIDRMSARESALEKVMHGLRPRLETYVQDVRADRDLGWVPVNDHYFLGRLNFGKKLGMTTFVPDPPSRARRWIGPLDDAVSRPFAHLFVMDYSRNGFVRMMFPDVDGFDRSHYIYNFIRREFLGDVRCLVFDVAPVGSLGQSHNRFIGRIWIEDQDDNLVRFDGTIEAHNSGHRYVHFDSWRVNVEPNLWVPAYIYTEETSMAYGLDGHAHMRGQTRIWGYDLRYAGRQEELTDINIESPEVKDPSELNTDPSPYQASRLWERQAENNILERLEKAGLVSPEGEVDRVLDDTVNNLIYSNNLKIDPPVRCRVLLTTPLESLAIGHTIVLSRGLIDVLPDDASLAAVLAHELGHIATGQQLDTRYAFSDRMFVPDEDLFASLHLQRTPYEEEQADAKAMQILMNSPYKNKLDRAGIFLRALVAHAPGTPNLVRPELGSRLFEDGYLQRLNAILAAAPPYLPKRVDQLAALPLGARIHLDPWTAQLSIVAKVEVPPLLSAREKMPFEVTPFFPYLTRYTAPVNSEAQIQTPAAAPATQAQISGPMPPQSQP